MEVRLEQCCKHHGSVLQCVSKYLPKLALVYIVPQLLSPHCVRFHLSCRMIQAPAGQALRQIFRPLHLLVEDYQHIFRGVKYQDVPEDRQYDFVFCVVRIILD